MREKIEQIKREAEEKIEKISNSRRFTRSKKYLFK